MQRGTKKKWPILLCTFVVAICGAYLAMTYLTIRKGNDEEYTVERLSKADNSNSVFQGINYTIADIIDDTMQSVVGISMLKANEESLFDISTAKKWGLGTGIIVSGNGYILTNQHLARNVNTKLVVTLPGGESVQGRVVWCNENIDLAIVKVDKNNLKPAILGDSDSTRIGDTVYAIGNPLGVEFERTTTSGIISGINRTLSFEENGKTVVMEDLIQTDASINSGNSGGPLINSNGDVIGVNTVKITSAEGIGFAVPINLVRPIIDRFIKDNYFEEAYLGLFVYDKEIVKYADSSIDIDSGVYVTDVAKNSPAEDAGLSKGDIVLSIDGIDMNKVTDLRRYIFSKKKGDTIIMLVKRNDEITNVRLRLE